MDTSNSAKSKVIKLSFPYEHEGESITHLRLTRLKVKHLKFIPDSLMKDEGKGVNPSEMVPLLASMCGLSEEGIGEMDFSDLEKVVEGMEDFLEIAMSQQIGNK